MIYLNEVPLRPFFVNSADDSYHNDPVEDYVVDGTEFLSEDDEDPED